MTQREAIDRPVPLTAKHELDIPPMTLDTLHKDMVDGFSEIVNVIADNDRMIRMEMLQLRTDLSPRMSEVEKRTIGQHLGSGAVGTIKWTAYATAAVGLLTFLAKRFPELQAIADIAKTIVP